MKVICVCAVRCGQGRESQSESECSFFFFFWSLGLGWDWIGIGMGNAQHERKLVWLQVRSALTLEGRRVWVSFFFLFCHQGACIVRFYAYLTYLTLGTL